MQKPGALWMGARKLLSRPEALNSTYVILRMRVDELNRLDYLLKALKDKTQHAPTDSAVLVERIGGRCEDVPFWMAGYINRPRWQGSLRFRLSPQSLSAKKWRVIAAQLSLEACHDEIQQFRNNVASIRVL